MTDGEFRHATPLTAAGVLFFDNEGRVMLVHTTYTEQCEIPGGIIEPGESPSTAAAREVEEELGIRPPIGPLLVVDWAPKDDNDKILFVFDGGILTTEHREAINVDGIELSGFEFCEPEKVGERTVDRLTRRLEAAFIARAQGRTLYLEHGVARG